MSAYEIKNYSVIREKINSDIASFIGQSFEHVCKELLLKMNREKKAPIFFERLGRQWGKFKGENGRDAYEIDIVAINEKTKDILFCECKWQEKADARKILAELKEKAKYVQWNSEKRSEYYAIFAKSFKEKIKEQNTTFFDLADLQTLFVKPRTK